MGRTKKFDFALAWPEEREEAFISFIKSECHLYKMSFFWINDNNIDHTINHLESGKIKIKFLFDMNATYSVPDDKYARLCYAVKDSGGKVLNDPDDAKEATDKSIAHYDLLEEGVNVPFTVVVRKWESDKFKLTEAERKNLGKPFVIKPACGYGWSGVITDAKSLAKMAKAKKYANGDNFLLQEKIQAISFHDKLAYYRVFHVMGEYIPCWWDPRTSIYEHVKFHEMYEYNLFSIVILAMRLSSITGMGFFSTEIAIARKGEVEIPITIDYINDQCDLAIKSLERSAPPDDVVKHIIHRIVQKAWELNQGNVRDSGYSIYLGR
ncbi:MAG: hypothetical protein JW827_00890 [Spirochaetes bacterium]|nr:hypothetical protein [Spirochaetota bacterium]